MGTWLASITSQNVPRIVLALGLLGLAVVVLALGLWYYRRRWISGSESGPAGWTLENLRSMKERGDITETEYQVLRASLLGIAEPKTGIRPSERGNSPDPSGETVWSFDLKKSPPG